MTVITRRRLLGAGLVVAAGGAGVTAGVLRPRNGPRDAVIPAVLLDAASRESALIASIDSVTDPALRGLLVPIRADHVAHLATVGGLIAHVAGPSTPAARATTPAAGAAPGAATGEELLAAERAAQQSWAQASAGVSGDEAALFASISACEATHAALLT